ncbi:MULTISPECIES: glutathione S-transferase C-terminal domain-containing protein [Prochlorococcus]|uniref:glutathione S-transferase C-terminal domain-containing protein n=1 Tax=Prochlorococcus TaxID=1218 RepID=UPI0005339574|nr:MULTISPECIES: glutathione S-transferase family protein [Prochlorococcus]KGG13145.1 Glutathione S-transferase [Prochlorococcus sp. MIT 0601]
MSIPPTIVAFTRDTWKWEWIQLMKGLAPADKEGNYKRVPSQKNNAHIQHPETLVNRSKNELPFLIIGRSCPWAHRTWLVYILRGLQNNIDLKLATPDPQGGRWLIEPNFMGCKTLLELYKLCRTPPSHRATVPTIIDPKPKGKNNPELLGNESAQLIKMLNDWPVKSNAINLFPKGIQDEIKQCSELMQSSINDGVYRCGFARTQKAYEDASSELFHSLSLIEKKLSKQGPWICGDTLTLADIMLFPTLIRWESVYAPLFKCSAKPLWAFPKIWEWRKTFFSIPGVKNTCDANVWRRDYFGALFPLNPSNIIPNGPNIENIVNSLAPYTR